VRMWVDVLPSVGLVSIIAKEGNVDLSHDDARAWANLLARGATVFQTDEPAALIDYIHRSQGSTH
jgi:glycerophosphoryl diester phosphodiesterase